MLTEIRYFYKYTTKRSDIQLFFVNYSPHFVLIGLLTVKCQQHYKINF